MDNFQFFETFMALRNPEHITDLEWFEEFYSDSGKSDRQNCLTLVHKTNSLLATYKFELIDKLITEMDVKRLTPLIMVGVLRYVCCAKEKLPSWKISVQRVYDELVLRDDEADRIMMGLIPKK